jgi:hypothetical protein
VFEIGDKVLIRNEFRTSKIQDHFKDGGTIIEKEDGDVYKIRDKNGKILRKHEVQIKKVGKERLDHVVKNQ